MPEITNPVIQKLELLMLGWGFNFYRAENRLRADDLLVRQKICVPLGHGVEKLGTLATEFQTHWMPAPTREQPYPPAELTGILRELNALRSGISAAAAYIQGLPAPAEDRIWRRFRDERMLMEQLLGADLRMLQLSADIESSVEKVVLAELKKPESLRPVVLALDNLKNACRDRQKLLEIQA